jgi:hypothetical protein
MPPKLLVHVWVLWTPDAEDIIPQVEVGINSHVGLAQGHEGRNV